MFQQSTYWYNTDNAKNVLEGDITGSPTLSLRLYYDRYLKVIDEPINCTIEGDLEKIKEGSSATVTNFCTDYFDGMVFIHRIESKCSSSQQVIADYIVHPDRFNFITVIRRPGHRSTAAFFNFL